MPSANGFGNSNHHRQQWLGARRDARIYAWFVERFNSADLKRPRRWYWPGIAL
jgi:hypothetical protein